MQHIWQFWAFLFWITLGLFVMNQYMLLRLIILSELIWGILFVLVNLIGLKLGNLYFVSFTFFILVFSSIEFVVGVFLLIVFKLLNITKVQLYLNDVKVTSHENYRLKKYYYNFFKI